MFKSLNGKTVLITGASSGIGSAIAQEYAKATNGNIRLILTARRTSRLDELAKRLQSEYPAVEILKAELDVSRRDSIGTFWDSLKHPFEIIDILVNNAGKALGSETVGLIDPEDVESVYMTNVIGTISIAQLVVSQMKARNSGDIVQLGSIAGRDTYPSGSIYCSSKAAVRSFTDALRKELISTKIRIIEIAPGNTRTEFSLVRAKGDAAQMEKAYEGMEPLRSSDVADVVVFATSRRSNTVLSEVVIMATSQAGPNHVYRGVQIKNVQ
jgi:3-hydroxy acid dehydrogenase/malonic semialdehyde reductase